ncbi:mitochondrial protein [Phlebopus sp. FC_14]|nr:mitochondrial protein [Phlebopus sp. FC_14]
MEPLARKILVVGGNGFIGSAVCKAALARGMRVTSISSSGQPYRTPKGHTPAWTSKVEWQKADALLPKTYSHILPEVNAVVHTLGTLLEDSRYKTALANKSILGLVGAFANGSGNPLERGGRGSYEVMNRDSALRVCEAFVSSQPLPETTDVRPFIYISAEDIFRPLIPARYIETKREAEQGIAQLVRDRPHHRGVFVRPSLVYHAHYRPLTSPLAALIDLSASLHASLPNGFPTPSAVLRALGSAFPSSPESQMPSPLNSVANALSIPPIHVEHVAEAICVALDPARNVRGVVGVKEMRELIGWSEKGKVPQPGHA